MKNNSKEGVCLIIKTVSLTQPWATLVSAGVKTIETRSWPAKHRGPLAIHASKNFPGYARELCLQEPFRMALKKEGYNDPADLPLGVVVAICRLDTVWKIEKESWTPPDQQPFGDFTPGRYAWDLVEVTKLKEFEPAEGHLGLWDWRVPENILHTQ